MALTMFVDQIHVRLFQLVVYWVPERFFSSSHPYQKVCFFVPHSKKIVSVGNFLFLSFSPNYRCYMLKY